MLLVLVTTAVVLGLLNLEFSGPATNTPKTMSEFRCRPWCESLMEPGAAENEGIVSGDLWNSKKLGKIAAINCSDSTPTAQ